MIRIENLIKDYGSFRALNGLSMEIHRGEVLGLLGPNGAGKTTTLRIITGYLRPTSGRVTVGGTDITEQPLPVKQLIGYLPESAPLYREMLVYDYLIHTAAVRGLSARAGRDRIGHLADLCGLREVMHKPVSALSKGYRQRTGLAAALMSDPEILILDEPTSGLDPNQISGIRRIIREIGRTKTVIFSTHILSEAEAVCDRVVIINRGRIAADGSAEMLKNRTGGSENLRLILTGGTGEEYRRVLSELEGVLTVRTGDGAGEKDQTVLTVETSGDRRKEIYLALRDRDWILLEMIRQKKSLEHIFRELTGETDHEPQ